MMISFGWVGLKRREGWFRAYENGEFPGLASGVVMASSDTGAGGNQWVERQE
jgi:hypothetical protein